MLQLYYAATSPYVRKVMVVAHHLGVADGIKHLAAAANPVNRDRNIATFNPLAKVPAARTNDGLCLYDSRVICEYIDSERGGGLFPAPGRARWIALTQQALADGLLDAALLVRYERTLRPAELRWAQWDAGQMSKIADCLNEIEAQAATLGTVRFTIGEVSIACALGYLDFRYPEVGWREGRPKAAAWYEKFSQLPAMQATMPPA